MKIQNLPDLQRLLAILAIAGLVTAAASADAQNSGATTTPVQTAQPVAATPAPQLAYGTSEILQLSQAKIGDDTIVAYVRNSGNSYGLDASQIIYLRQQGVSEPVITAMLNQPKPAAAPAAAPTTAATSIPMPTTPPPTVAAAEASAVVDNSATAAPSVAYVQTVPTYYYSYPYYYPYYYGYGWYPGIVWGGYYGGWRGGYHGYYGGGFHGGGGYHGGGGGFHGGGGGHR